MMHALQVLELSFDQPMKWLDLAIMRVTGDLQIDAVIGSVLLLYALIAASRVLGRSLGELFRA